MSDQGPMSSSLDIVCMPAAGYAAYWLSLKKLLDRRNNPRDLGDELAYTTEPYTRLLLEAAGTALSDEAVRRMARYKKITLIRDYRRKLQLISITTCAMATAENPRRTLISLAHAFGLPVIEESKTMEQAQGLLETMRAGDLDPAVFPDVSHTTKAGELILKLLFLLLWARREGKQSLQVFLPGVSFPYLADALQLYIDGLDEPFIRRRLDSLARELIIEASAKMTMALELAMAIKARQPYEEMLALAKAFLPE